jgi:signal transduction histidine kinase/DNA-binding response OmpR family regulator/ligand-binding sensor domain-containing protein
MRLSNFLISAITVFFSVIISVQGLSAEQERFMHFTEIDGLPRNIITCLEQDQYGYLWIGTTNGIARYDGKNFFKYEELTGIGINFLYYSSDKTLWVASNRGLYKYKRLTNSFEHVAIGYISKIQEDQGDVYFLMMSSIYKVDDQGIVNVHQGNELSDFCFSSEGLWISYTNGGVCLKSRENNFNQNRATYLQEKSVSIIRKIDDNFIVGCYNGQLYSMKADGTIKPIVLDNHYFYRDIVKVGDETWLATDGNGIIILDKNLQFSKVLNRKSNTAASIISNSIYDVLPGNNQEIWIATYGTGLTCILPDNLMFQNILPEKGNSNSLVANEGVSVYIKDPLVYFGTNYGLSEWNASTLSFKNFSSEKLKSELNGTKVSAITADQHNNLWIGTYDGLMGKYSANYQLLKNYHPSSIAPDEMQQIVQLQLVDKNNLLVLTQFHSRILLNFHIQDETTNLFELYSKGSNITYCLLNTLRENQKDELLAVISDQGVFHVNWKDNVLENRLVDMNTQIGCYIVDFYHDREGTYWFASSTNGLVSLSEDGKNRKNFTTREGLPSNSLVRLESVDDRFLWISTISGICRFDMETGEALNFNHRDGLPANEFLERVSGKTNDGKIIFGCMAGFTIIDPSKVNAEVPGTEVIISDITFQNQSIRSAHGKQFLDCPLEEAREIKLPYNKNSFSIHFFEKNKVFSKYQNYSYRLIGLEKDWVYLGETNFATYTNLSAGNYTFEIKSADKRSDGLVTRLDIYIQPPWYMSVYAYLAYMIIIFTILYLSFYALLKRIELKKEKEIAELKILNEHELTEKKLAFFTNISHDLKTPLTLIDAPVNDLLQSENLSHDQRNKLGIINRNSKRLYKLITDLLDFRKITQKQLVLEVSETSITAILSEIVAAFSEECKNKSILLKYSPSTPLTCYVDARKIEKIIWNLLSNALKFTSKGGTIELNANITNIDGHSFLKLVVSDNGIGISENDQSKIFNSFFKVQDSNSEGTGIGLSIVKELVEIHHGKIELNSLLGSGTTFTILLPADRELYDECEIIEQHGQAFQATKVDMQSNWETNEADVPRTKHDHLPKILVVEDNHELREYLAGHFEKHFKVNQANDGADGLQMAKEINPDIILTDVQMPNMNGYEFCKEIRQNFDTSHIPIVMLTANDTTDHHIEGLSTGADAYLTKPFDIKLLDTTLNSILENRKKLRQKFTSHEPQRELDKSLPPKDIEFILELQQFIEENIINQNLNVELISDHFNVSLAQLHRKIKALTGTTPNNMIKSIRLKKAYQLIRHEGYRVSEAAYQTGFNDPNYFTTCFKKEFGENPSQI